MSDNDIFCVNESDLPELLEQVERQVRRKARGRVPRDAVDDIVQEVLAKVVRRIGRDRSFPHGFRRWVARTTWHTIVDFYRRKNKKLPGVGQAVEGANDGSDADSSQSDAPEREESGEHGAPAAAQETVEQVPDLQPDPPTLAERRELMYLCDRFFLRIARPRRYSREKAAIRRAVLELKTSKRVELRRHQAVAALELPRDHANELITKVRGMLRDEQTLHEVRLLYIYQYRLDPVLTWAECWETDDLRHLDAGLRKERRGLLERLFCELKLCFERGRRPAPVGHVRSALKRLKPTDRKKAAAKRTLKKNDGQD